MDPESESDQDNGLIIYREKPAAEIYHKGRCTAPLGSSQSHDVMTTELSQSHDIKRRATNEQRSKKKQAQEEEEVRQNEKLMRNSV